MEKKKGTLKNEIKPPDSLRQAKVEKPSKTIIISCMLSN